MEYEPKSYKQVMINLFGDIEIVGKDLLLTKSDIPEPIRFLIAYLAMNPGRAVCADRLNELYGEYIASWKNLVYKFRTRWKNARLMLSVFNSINTPELGAVAIKQIKLLVGI